ncbi:hypothetical protein QUW45_06720 [Limosilactobacillus pontis]|uniref:hypothetical protein n=1 Tax=Limosilactobacillus pontis TaxID=35787 RepID=UPI0025A3DAFA|nr:hypothetical protein [Limosilactobacillus pontis]MDM8332369.1 hypothetical protein [Limosilactobacillus pontis]
MKKTVTTIQKVLRVKKGTDEETWVNNQENINWSLRKLIDVAIALYGTDDLGKVVTIDMVNRIANRKSSDKQTSSAKKVDTPTSTSTKVTSEDKDTKVPDQKDYNDKLDKTNEDDDGSNPMSMLS